MTKSDKAIAKILNKSCFSQNTFLEMNQVFKTYKKNLGIAAFEYARVYDDNHAMMLYSNPDIAKYVITEELHITAHVPKEIIDKDFWFMPPPNGPYSTVVQELKNISSVNSFANYIRRDSGFYEMFSFWRTEDQSVASNKFLNMKEILEQHCLAFTDQYKGMISEADKERFKLTDPMKPNFGGLGSDEQTTNIMLSLYVSKIQQELIKLNSHLYSKLSKQELRCVSLLFEGKTATDIASLIHLSPRTVEMHLNSIRTKLNCRKKSDIISTLVSISKTIQNNHSKSINKESTL